MGRDVEGESAGEAEGEGEVEGEWNGGGVSGRGRLEAIWISWSSSAGSGDVVEVAAVFPLLLPPSLTGLSPLTASGVDPPSLLLVM